MGRVDESKVKRQLEQFGTAQNGSRGGAVEVSKTVKVNGTVQLEQAV
jgi:hypothetical protein